MLSVLLKKQLDERLSYLKRKIKNADIIGALLSLLLFAAVIYAVVEVFSMFAEKYCVIRIGGVLNVEARRYELMTIIYEIVIFVGIFSSVGSINYSIFESDDRVLMVQVPIKKSVIFASKIIEIYLRQAVITLCVTIPLIGVFTTVTEQSAGFFAIAVAAGLSLPLFSIGAASVLCLPCYYVKKFFQSKYLSMLCAVTAVMGVCFFGYSRILSAVQSLMSTGEMRFFFSGGVMAKIAAVTKVMFPANFIAGAVSGVNVRKNALILIFSLAAVICAGCFIIYMLYNAALQSRFESKTETKFVFNKIQRRLSVPQTLLLKEVSTVFYTPDYALQYFSVAIIMPLMVYFCMSIGKEIMSSIVLAQSNFELAILLVALFGSLTNTFCATNISRDGKTFFIQKTLPIKYSGIIGAKLTFNMLVGILSIGISVIILEALRYVSFGEGSFVFLIGCITSAAQILFATRIDLNRPRFPQEDDNLVKESNKNVSAIILLGIVTSIILGGVPLYVSVLNSLKGEGSAAFTYVFTLLSAVIALILSVIYMFVGLKSRFENLTEDD